MRPGLLITIAAVLVACKPMPERCVRGTFLDEARRECVPMVPEDYPGETEPPAPEGGPIGQYDGPWQLATVDSECDGAAFVVEITTDGWAANMRFRIGDTSGWSGGPTTDVTRENHPMNQVDFAQDGSWDRWDLILEGAVASQAVTLGTSSQFDCAQTGLTFRADMLDDSSGLMDCGIWGDQPDAFWNEALGWDCDCFDC